MNGALVRRFGEKRNWLKREIEVRGLLVYPPSTGQKITQIHTVLCTYAAEDHWLAGHR